MKKGILVRQLKTPKASSQKEKKAKSTQKILQKVRVCVCVCVCTCVCVRERESCRNEGGASDLNSL